MLNPSVQLITPPASEPVTLAELKAQARVNTGTAEDAELTRYLSAARELFERRTGRAVLPTQFRQKFAGWPGDGLELWRGPVLSVESVKYIDPDGVTQTLTGWELDASGVPGVVLLPESLPALHRWKTRPVAVEFTAGWPDASEVPATVRTAILLLAAHYYRNREAFTDQAARELPEGFAAVCDLFQTCLDWGH